jgi:hypothetical protein
LPTRQSNLHAFELGEGLERTIAAGYDAAMSKPAQDEIGNPHDGLVARCAPLGISAERRLSGTIRITFPYMGQIWLRNPIDFQIHAFRLQVA